jgi:hypothetical protein
MEEGKYFMLLEAALSNLIKIGTLTVTFLDGSQRDLERIRTERELTAARGASALTSLQWARPVSHSIGWRQCAS